MKLFSGTCNEDFAKRVLFCGKNIGRFENNKIQDGEIRVIVEEMFGKKIVLLFSHL